MGVIDVADVADGDYEVKFLLPQKDGTYVECALPGTVVIASGTATIR